MGVNSEAGLRTAWRNSDQSQQSGITPLPNAFSNMTLQDEKELDEIGTTQQPDLGAAAPVTMLGTCPDAHPQSPEDGTYHCLRQCVDEMWNSRWGVEYVGKTYSKYAKMREEGTSLCKSLLNACLQRNSISPKSPIKTNVSPQAAIAISSINAGVEDLSQNMGALNLGLNNATMSPGVQSLPPPSTPRMICSKARGLRAAAHMREQFMGAIRDWKACQERLLEALRMSLLEMYQEADPGATVAGFELLCVDRSARRAAVKKIQQARMVTLDRLDCHPGLSLFSNLSIAAPDGNGFLTGYEIRFGNYDLVQTDLNDTRRLLYAGESGIPPGTTIQDCVISERGNAILEFANTAIEGSPVLRFRVSSHMLAEVSPVFAQIFGHESISGLNGNSAENKGKSSGNAGGGERGVGNVNSRNKPRGTSGAFLNAGGYEHAIRLPPPPTRYTCEDGSEVSLYRMPQTELNKRRAMEIVLHAAHMHNDMVPRDVEFGQFVAIAEVCQRYRCTSPLELAVEHRWMPQWMHRVSASAADPAPDGLLVIAYAFGMRRLFTRVSKSAILNVVDEAELRAKPWPRPVKDRIWAIREAKIQQVYTCCSNALQEYLRPPPPLPQSCQPSYNGQNFGHGRLVQNSGVFSGNSVRSTTTVDTGNATGNASGVSSDTTAADGNTRTSIFMPTGAPRCPKGSHACDAASLGWLMMTFAELQVLQHIVKSPSIVGHLPPPPPRSLNQLFDSLRFMASPPQPQDGQHQDYYYGPCDYASAFRSATNDVFNSVPGLTLFEVAGRHGWALSRHKHDQPQASKHAAFPLKLKEMNKMQLMYYYHTRRKGPEAVQMAREAVRLRILTHLDNFADLHAAAMVDRSFYETYKKNELALMRGVLKKEAMRRRSDPVSSALSRRAAGNEGFGEEESHGTRTMRPAGSVKKNSMPAMPTTTGRLDHQVSYFDVSDDDEDDGEATGDEDGSDVDPMYLDSSPHMRENTTRSSPNMVTREEAERILWPPSPRSSQLLPSPAYSVTAQASTSTRIPRQQQSPTKPSTYRQQGQRKSTPAALTVDVPVTITDTGNKEKFLAGSGGLVVGEHKSLLPLSSEKHLRETYERLVGLRVDGPSG